MQNHLIPAFGEMKISDIKPVHIQRYINQASARYAPETVKKDYNCLKLIFDTAVDNQLCLKSPLTRSIKLPRYETRKDKHAFTQAQYDVAYAAAKKYGGLSIMLMLETGLSRSELLGLRWEDIDEENRCIRVTQGLVVYHDVDEDKQVLSSDGLKNKFRKRAVPIADDALWSRITQAPRTVKAGGRKIPTEYVVHSPEGKPYNPNNWVNRVFRPFMRRLHREHPDIPELSPHELRHPYVKHTTKIFSLRLMDFQAQAYPDARRKTRGACQLHRGGQSQSPVRPLCNRKRFSCLPPQAKMSWILYAMVFSCYFVPFRTSTYIAVWVTVWVKT